MEQFNKPIHGLEEKIELIDMENSEEAVRQAVRIGQEQMAQAVLLIFDEMEKDLRKRGVQEKGLTGLIYLRELVEELRKNPPRLTTGILNEENVRPQ